MRPPALEDLERQGIAVVVPGGVVFHVPEDWPAEGEDRIGYVSILRLVECVREEHWRRTVLPEAGDPPVDSITKSLSAEFFAPVCPGTPVLGRSRVTRGGARSYELTVDLVVRDTGEPLMRAVLVGVFYDADAGRSTVPPEAVAASLRVDL